MTVSKLESRNDKEAIAEEISILTEVLDDVTKKMIGNDSFDKINLLKKLSVEEKHQDLEEAIKGLNNNEMVVVSRYFAILPLLINISEDVNLAYEVNYQNNNDINYLGKISATIDLVSEQDNAQEILKMLMSYRF